MIATQPVLDAHNFGIDDGMSAIKLNEWNLAKFACGCQRYYCSTVVWHVYIVYMPGEKKMAATRTGCSYPSFGSSLPSEILLM